MNVRPIDERVLLTVVEKDEKTSGGIIIPDTVSKEQPQIGEVVAVGDDITDTRENRKPLSQIVNVGDQILFAKYGGTEVDIDNKKYLLVNRTDILGVIEK